MFFLLRKLLSFPIADLGRLHYSGVQYQITDTLKIDDDRDCGEVFQDLPACDPTTTNPNWSSHLGQGCLETRQKN